MKELQLQTPKSNPTSDPPPLPRLRVAEHLRGGGGDRLAPGGVGAAPQCASGHFWWTKTMGKMEVSDGFPLWIVSDYLYIIIYLYIHIYIYTYLYVYLYL